LLSSRAVLTLGPKFLCCRRESLMDTHEKCNRKRNVRHVNRHHKYCVLLNYTIQICTYFFNHIKE
jgi:hypothetical protein